MSTSPNDRMYEVGESSLLVFSWLMALHTVCTFYNEHIGMYWRNLSFNKVPVFFSRVVASVENLEPCDVNKEHACPEDVSGVIWSECDSRTGRNDLVS